MGPTEETVCSAEELARASNNLGFRLLSLLLPQDPGRNVLISSFSVALALAMTYNGAERKTKQALAEILGLRNIKAEDLNAASKALMSIGQGLVPGVQLHVANSIWVRRGVQPAPEFVQSIEDAYDGEFASVDLADPATAEVINDWVARKTHDLIDQLVTPRLIKLAVLILINAIAFKGIWTHQFDKTETKDAPFTLFDGSCKQLPMMSQQGRYDYHEDDRLQAVSLPYGTGRVSMVICLPKPSVSIGEFQRTLTMEKWQSWMSQLAETQGEIALPRFRLAYETELLPHLKALGGEAIAQTDFRGMGAGPLLISNVIHKAFMKVNEEGTEAAAATAVIMARSISHRFHMIVNRPFFCVIRDERTGLILFMGLVLDPTPA